MYVVFSIGFVCLMRCRESSLAFSCLIFVVFYKFVWLYIFKAFCNRFGAFRHGMLILKFSKKCRVSSYRGNDRQFSFFILGFNFFLVGSLYWTLSVWLNEIKVFRKRLYSNEFWWESLQPKFVLTLSYFEYIL